jgi:hypothetical protein
MLLRFLGFLIVAVWTAMAIGLGYHLKEPEKNPSPIVIENVCPEPAPTVATHEPPIVIHIEEVVADRTVESQESKPSSVIEATQKRNLEVLIGYQGSASGGGAEAILKMPVSNKMGAYVGYTTRNDFSVGVSYQF